MLEKGTFCPFQNGFAVRALWFLLIHHFNFLGRRNWWSYLPQRYSCLLQPKWKGFLEPHTE